MALLDGKRILLGVTGGIAAYKTPELVRRLKDAGADVHVVLSEAATHFVSPLALEVVSEHPVGLDLWSTTQHSGHSGTQSRINHTDLAKDSDLVLVAPATANLIGKLRHGLADDLLSTTIMAAKTPVLLCPAMNTEMLDNPIVADNLAALAALGGNNPRYHLLEPGLGLLACGILGRGRMPDPPDIIEAAASVLTPKTLKGLRVTVTAGPTYEPIDPVRFLGNRSTGTMGFNLARAFAAAGAHVNLVAGPVEQRTPVGVAQRLDIESAADMLAAVESLWPHTDILVMSAAIADFTPVERHDQKVKKQVEAPPLLLKRTADILLTMSQKPDRERVTLVGFAAETQNVVEYAKGKLERKNLDFILANQVGQAGTGFGRGDNAGLLIPRQGEPIPLERTSKERFAQRIVELLSPALWARKA